MSKLEVGKSYVSQGGDDLIIHEVWYVVTIGRATRLVRQEELETLVTSSSDISTKSIGASELAMTRVDAESIQHQHESKPQTTDTTSDVPWWRREIHEPPRGRFGY
jgi:hypothetical protein